MRLATFNLLHGVPVTGGGPEGFAEGREPITDDVALRESVAAIGADILGLQEVDVHQSRSDGSHQVHAAAQATAAAYWRFVPAVRGTPGVERDWEPADDGDHHTHDRMVNDGPRYGIGLVSRFPVREWHSTVFDAAPWSLPLLVPSSPRARIMRIPDEPRVAVAAVIESPDGIITVATTHLSFVPGYNVRQLRRLRSWLAGLPRPLVLMGDFNLPGSLPRRITGWQSLATAPTYPSYHPRVQFDHVLADGLTAAQVASARAESMALPVSDHCALRVDLTLR